MIGRLVTAAVGIPALAVVVWLGGDVFVVVVAALAALGAIEVCEMARSRKITPSRAAAAGFSVVIVLSYYYASGTIDSILERPWLVIVTIGITVLALVLIYSPIEKFQDRNAGLTLAAVVYPGALLAHAPLLRGGEQGLEWIVFLLAVTFSSDTGAFFVGKTIGNRPLAPSISPNKTWEGAVGGFVAAILAAFLAAWALDIDADLSLVAILGALMGVVGQAGDLFESKLKRLADVKESGSLLPGHGGVLDRLDSIVFNLALVYYFVIGGAL